jgi:phosphohistidine phosphatase
MTREAKTIAKLDLGLDAIVTSPLARAKQTAQIVADRLDMHDKLREDERLAGNFDTSKLAAILQERADDATIMLVGHEPDFSAIVGRLAGGANIDLKKGGLACVDIPDRSSMQGRLLCLLPPKVLVL